MKILPYKLFIENNHYKGTSWIDTIDGEEVTITIQELENYLDSIDAPIVDIPVDDLFNMCTHKDKTDMGTLDRSEKSDLSFPIIVAKGLDGKWVRVLDGHHRLLKAHNKGESMVRARVLDLKFAPKNYQRMFE